MRKFFCLGVAFGCAFSIYSCNNNSDSNHIKLVNLGDNLQLNNFYCSEFLKNPVDSNINPVSNGKLELSRPSPVPLSWTANGVDSRPFMIKISENEDMSNPLIYTTNDTKYDLFNVKINTKYYWTVEAGNYKSSVGTFASKNLEFRNIYIDGVTNCRDLGGHKTIEGKEINQGLIYRTGRYNSSLFDYPMRDITPQGMYTFTRELEIKTEIDLRGEDRETGGISKEATKGVIDGASYKYCGMRWKDDDGKKIDNLIFNEINQTVLKDLFNNVLSNKDYYPLSFHCDKGTDRAGAIAYTILALCGVKKETLVADYLLSNYGLIGSKRQFKNIENSYPKNYDDAEGITLMEKTANAIKQIGVTDEAINKIRSILIK